MKHYFQKLFFLSVLSIPGFAYSAEYPDVLEPASILKPLPEEYGDTHRHFQGIPSMTVAPNGRVWSTWYSGGETECDLNYILVATSNDMGKTWSKPLFAIDVPGPVRLFDPEMWTDPNGRVWLFWAQSWGHQADRSGVWCMIAENGGSEETTWSKPRRLSDGIMMCKPIVDSKERWILPVDIWNWAKYTDRTLPPGAHTVVSTDKGKTWNVIGGVKISDEDANCNEHMIVEKKDGSFWKLIRTKYGIGESFSMDGGVTWSELKRSSIAHTTSRFFIYRLQSGNLVLVKHGAVDVRAGRSHLTAYLSVDDGKTWKGGLMLDERNGVSYPDGMQTKDGTIYIIYDYSRTGAKEILMARLTEEDILEQKIISNIGALRLLVNKSTALPPLPKPLVFKSDPNSDGKPLLTGSSPELLPINAEQGIFKTGAKIFLDRDYMFHKYPKELEGKKYLRSSIDQCQAMCQSDGVVYILTPSKTRNKDSAVKRSGRIIGLKHCHNATRLIRFAAFPSSMFAV